MLGDMPADEFRRYGHELVDWIANYLENPAQYPVLSQVKPGEITAQLPEAPPSAPEDMATILADFHDIIMPGITHWNHPAFYAYFSISSAAPAILAEMLANTLNVNGMLWKTSPAATELEEVTLDWLRQMLGLPPDFKGVITDTASMSSLLAIAAARENLNLNVRQNGMHDMPRLRLYTSEQAHSSIEKAAMVLGLGQTGCRKIPTDENFSMDADALVAAIEEDITNGWKPFMVAASVGTTSTTSSDPVARLAEICQQYDLWLHVDGAYGGLMAIVPEFRSVLAGCEHADSFVTNPHKWLFTPIDLSAFYVKNPDILKQAFSILPEYLKTNETVNNYMDWGVQLGRRFRALKLWMVIRYFGHDRLAANIREHVRLAQWMAEQIDAHPDFERMAPTPMSTVCFRYRPAHADNLEALNRALMESINATGEAYFSHTKLRGEYTLRMAIGNLRTTPAHIERAWELLQAHASPSEPL